MKKIVLFGAGNDGSEALSFFGKDNVICFVDNNIRKIGLNIQGKDVYSFDFFSESIINRYDIDEIIITVGFSRWAVFAIAHQLKNIGIDSFSIYSDVKRRWKNGEEFLNRDKKNFPCEQESILEIYKFQLEWMVRHTDAKDLKPALGSLREYQIDELEKVKYFLRIVDSLQLKFIMCFGTLIGAIRHKGFIPWDDDMDLCLVENEYKRLIEYVEQSKKIKPFYPNEEGIYLTKELESKAPLEYDFILIIGRGYAQLFLNEGKDNWYENKLITDIIPLYYFREDYTKEMYKLDHDYWLNKRLEDFNKTEIEFKDSGFIQKNTVEKSSHLGIMFDWTSFYGFHVSSTRKLIDDCLFDYSDFFPLQKLTFEDIELWAPKDPLAILMQINHGMDIMAIPKKSVGINVHNKDALFNEEY